jgi:hypothetical protein
MPLGAANQDRVAEESLFPNYQHSTVVYGEELPFKKAARGRAPVPGVGSKLTRPCEVQETGGVGFTKPLCSPPRVWIEY